ncbi:MAG: galactose oxidase [Gemmataceae bacterium]
MNRRVFLALVPGMSLGGAAVQSVGLERKALACLPDREGFAGSFAGISGGTLLVAGGANFPGKKPWEGGKKVWHDRVFALTTPDGSWNVAGKLPRPLAYGVSATFDDRVICVGGSDDKNHHRDVFTLHWKKDKLAIEDMPRLPRPLANACGAVVGDYLYVAGGQEHPDAVNTSSAAWKIHLTSRNPSWKEIEPVPGGGRMLSIAASIQGSFWVVGGVDLTTARGGKVERRYLKSIYRYHPSTGWEPRADLPFPIAAAPSPAPIDANGFFLLGGDDGSQVGIDPNRHRGFSKKVLRYHFKENRWNEWGDLASPRVTTPCVLWENRWTIPSGETRPGIRSPEVITYILKAGD